MLLSQSEGDEAEPLDRREQRRADREAAKVALVARRNAREHKQDVRSDPARHILGVPSKSMRKQKPRIGSSELTADLTIPICATLVHAVNTCTTINLAQT